MLLLESGEMYLETILVLYESGKTVVRAIDVGEYMGYSRPSVSRALSRLKADGYVTVDGDGYISFTDKGRSVAEKIYERHTILTKCLTMIGVDKDTAQEDSCRIEHVISDDTFSAIKAFVAKNEK